MAEIKFTKNELRLQQNRLQQLQKYLPTLQLKKAMLQSVINEARLEIKQCEDLFFAVREEVETFSPLLSENISIDVTKGAKVDKIYKRYENIAGVEVPYFDKMEFKPFEYSLFDTPPWTDTVILGLRRVVEANTRIEIAIEKKNALEKELREVSIRVNLFEKILIPRATTNIKKIKVFLGDQLLAAVSQAKAAKTKIQENKFQVNRAQRNQQALMEASN